MMKHKAHENQNNDLKHLAKLPEESKAVICEIKGGKEFQRRAAALGLAKGCEIEILKSSSLKGPVIVGLFGTKLALGHGMAEKIIVKKI